MASNSLSGVGVSPSNTAHQLLHIGTGTYGVTPITVRLGNGTATQIQLDTSGVILGGDTRVTNLAASQITLAGAVVKPAVWKYVTTTITATDTTVVQLAELDFVPVNGATYEVELMVLGQAAATAGALQIVNMGGSGNMALYQPNTATGIAAMGGTYAPTTSPVAGVFSTLLKGLYTATSVSPVTWGIKSDDTNDVSALFGTYVRFTKIS